MSVLSKLWVKLDKRYVISKKAQSCAILAERSALSFDELYDGSSFVRGLGLGSPAENHKTEVERELETTRLSPQIYEAYSRNQEKNGLIALKMLLREGRKYGYPLVCELGHCSVTEQLSWAAKLLIAASESRGGCDLPDVIELEERTALYEDAKYLLDISSGNKRLFGL